MNFIEFISEQKNTHMTHIEDKVLYGGVDGTRQAILALRSLRDMLAGVKDGNVSVKWDGAPAVFAGTDPRDGAFFVAKKGIFNATPKVYKSNNEPSNFIAIAARARPSPIDVATSAPVQPLSITFIDLSGNVIFIFFIFKL